MLFALARLMIIGFVVLTVIYVGVSIWSRRVRRRRLNDEWEQEGMTGDKESWVEEGLDDYDESFRRKLILGVYVVPILLIVIVVYLTNFK